MRNPFKNTVSYVKPKKPRKVRLKTTSKKPQLSQRDQMKRAIRSTRGVKSRGIGWK